MVFPQTQLPVKVEFDLGGWTDVTTYVREAPGINISRGRQDESSQAERTQATFTLENADGRFSERNPTGAYYGLLSLNTPCRISTTRDTKVLEMGGGQHNLVACPDAAPLDITGDIDIRVDAHLHDWRTSTHLANKWRSASGNQRSWAFVADDGFLRLWWSTGGTSGTRTSVRSTAPIPVTTGRLAVRVTLDVNNGAGGNTATFYTSDSISGSWTQLGLAVVTAGTTSIFSSTSACEVGGFTEASFTSLDPADLYGYTSVYGWIHAFQLRSGIAGTVVANPDFTIQDVGDPSFADTASSPNTWSVNSEAAITDRWWRFHGEISAWPQVWDQAMRDVTVTATAAGPLRRLTQGSTPLRSVLYESITKESTAPIGYWPCEDASGAVEVSSGLPTGKALKVFGSPGWAAYSGFDGSSGILQGGTATRMVGRIGAGTAYTHTQLQFLLHVPDAGMPTTCKFIRLFTTNFRFTVRYDNLGSNGRLLLDPDPFSGSSPQTSTITDINGLACCVTVDMIQDGADIDYNLSVYDPATDTTTTVSGSDTVMTIGTVESIELGGEFGSGEDMGETAIGHIVVRSYAADTSPSDLINAYRGEAAGDRFARLCVQEGLAYRAIGDLADTAPMGPQSPGQLIEQLRACEQVDLGMLFEPLDTLGLGYRTRKTLQNQTTALELDHAAGELASPPIPTSDDLPVGNDITVSLSTGLSSRIELTAGRMSTAAPPDGVGRYPQTETINASDGSTLADHAGLRLHLGTADEERYPQVEVSRVTPGVSANSGVNYSLLSLNIGHMLTVDNMPTPYTAPGQVKQIVQGWTEKLAAFRHDFTFNTTPGSVWDFGSFGTGDNSRLDTDGSELRAAINSSATSIVVTTTSGPIWVTTREDSAEFPFDIMVDGELMTVTAVSGVDHGFENGTGGWTAVDGTIAQSSTRALTGLTSGLLTVTGSPTQVYTRPAVADRAPVTVGQSYTYTGYVYSVAGYSSVSAAIDWFNAAGTYLSTSAVSFTIPAAAWTWTSVTATAPASAASAAYGPTIGSNPPGGTQIWIDRTSFTPTEAQTFTVTRSVNGVIKSHSAGADVRLASPMILSL